MKCKSESMEDSSSYLVPTMLDPSCVMWSNKNGMSTSTIDDSIPTLILLLLLLRLRRNFRVLNWIEIGQALPLQTSQFIRNTLEHQISSSLGSHQHSKTMSIRFNYLRIPETAYNSAVFDNKPSIWAIPFMPKSFVEYGLILWLLFVMWCDVMENADTRIGKFAQLLWWLIQSSTTCQTWEHVWTPFSTPSVPFKTRVIHFRNTCRQNNYHHILPRQTHGSLVVRDHITTRV